MDVSCGTCRHYSLHPLGGYGACRRYPAHKQVPEFHLCGEWSGLDGRTAPQAFTHVALDHLTKAQAALARAAHALREAGKGMAAEAAHRASKEAAQAIEELS